MCILTTMRLVKERRVPFIHDNNALNAVCIEHLLCVPIVIGFSILINILNSIINIMN